MYTGYSSCNLSTCICHNCVDMSQILLPNEYGSFCEIPSKRPRHAHIPLVNRLLCQTIRWSCLDHIWPTVWAASSSSPEPQLGRRRPDHLQWAFSGGQNLFPGVSSALVSTTPLILAQTCLMLHCFIQERYFLAACKFKHTYSSRHPMVDCSLIYLQASLTMVHGHRLQWTVHQ